MRRLDELTEARANDRRTTADAEKRVHIRPVSLSVTPSSDALP
jgi:hypothetical protein